MSRPATAAPERLVAESAVTTPVPSFEASVGDRDERVCKRVSGDGRRHLRPPWT